MDREHIEVDKNYKENNIIIKSSIKISRNLEEYPFIVALTEDISKKVFKDIYDKISDTSFLGKMNILSRAKSNEKKKFDAILDKFFEVYQVYNEQKLLQLLLSNEQNNIALAINLKDHLEILVSGFGNKLEECYQVAYKIENHISSQLKFAFDEKLGYLSSAISELGTGLKVSSCIHLPALSMIGYIDKLKEATSQIGFSLEEAFDLDTVEGSHYYLLSNKKTLGVSEEDIRISIENILEELLRKEIDARDTLISSKRIILEDRILRAYGLLKYSKLIGYDEAIDAISMIKLGISFALFKDIDENLLDEVIFNLKDYELYEKRVYSKLDREYWRSNLLKKIFIEELL